MWMDVRSVGGDGKPARQIPRKGGYFEIVLPRAFFEGNKAITVNWVDRPAVRKGLASQGALLGEETDTQAAAVTTAVRPIPGTVGRAATQRLELP
jgi:hypothetical protein